MSSEDQSQANDNMTHLMDSSLLKIAPRGGGLLLSSTETRDLSMLESTGPAGFQSPGSSAAHRIQIAIQNPDPSRGPAATAKTDKSAAKYATSGKTSTTRAVLCGSATASASASAKSKDLSGGFSAKLASTGKHYHQSSAIFKTNQFHKKLAVPSLDASSPALKGAHESVSAKSHAPQVHELPASSSFRSPAGGARSPGTEDRPGVPHKSHHKSHSTAKLPRAPNERHTSALYMTTGSQR